MYHYDMDTTHRHFNNPSYSLHSSVQFPSLSLDHANLVTSKRACLLIIEIWNAPLYEQDIVLIHFKLASRSKYMESTWVSTQEFVALLG